jgi:hypothetical protein
MLSLGAQILKLELRLAKPLVRFTGIEAARGAQDQLGRITAGTLKAKVTYEPVGFDDFQACFATSNVCEAPCDRAILYLTAAGIPPVRWITQRVSAGFLRRIRAYRVLRGVPASRRSINFPRRADDAMAAYRYLLDRAMRRTDCVCRGERGRGLEYCLALRCKDEGVPLPKCIVGISPWTDLTFFRRIVHNNVLRTRR